MKKLIFTAVLATIISVTAFADGGKKNTAEAGEQNVSYAVLTQFKSDFENASNIAWTVSPNCQAVRFTQNDINYTAYYDAIDQFWGVAQEVDYATITKAAKTSIAKNYAGYDIKSVTRFEPKNGEEAVVYFVTVKNAANEAVLTIAPNDGEIKNIDKVK